MAALCPSCRSPLSPSPGGAALACPRCHSGAGVGTRPGGPNSTADYRPDAAPTVTHKGPPAAPAAADVSFLPPPQRSDEIARLGPYRVLARVGAGGMGAVFRAEDTALGRVVALKVMLPQFAADPKSKARFLREARAQAKVEHENVVPVYDVGEHDGVTFLAMPLLNGQSAAAALRQNRRPPVREALRIAREVAQGLAAAHEVGLIHRDIKPGNVWLEGSRRRVKILDFGLARAANPHAPLASTADITLTVQGGVVGTPAFMSPEQAKGEPVDHRTDLYSLGVMLYQMTAGRLPYAGANALELLIAAETERLDPPDAVNPEVPPAVSDLVMRLLARNPAARPPTAQAVVNELRALEDAVVASADRPGAPPAVPPDDPWGDLGGDSTEAAAVRTRADEAAAAKKWPLFAAAAAAALLVVVAGVVALRPAPTTTPEEAALPLPPVPPVVPPVVPPRPKADPPAPQPKEVPPKPAPRDPPVLPELAGLKPLVVLDYSAGVPPNSPPPVTSPPAKYTRRATGTAYAFKMFNPGLWWVEAGPSLPGTAVEVRARVTSPTGAWAFNPIAYPSPVREGSRAGVVVAVDHAGELSVSEYSTGRPPGGFPTRTYSPKSVKSGREWNTVLAVVRGDRLDVYANGEKVDEGIPLWATPDRAVYFGISSSRGPAEVEYERVTIWDLPAAPKK